MISPILPSKELHHEILFYSPVLDRLLIAHDLDISDGLLTRDVRRMESVYNIHSKVWNPILNLNDKAHIDDSNSLLNNEKSSEYPTVLLAADRLIFPLESL